ncbi:hypothetical protein [Streptomyces sp. WAC06614]|uniref:LppU/SCO3897 family protein n=1 Tax=Streptomyces sp. WAC06614 TaxID=2487416 RepID=UPI000F7B3CEB|nr:hypothetical protein [Streptomyces sp. WAC06614]RSS81988.1 hypothetical protein EF918_08495 [Streptomyces sp. WAC06614]
MGMGKKVNRVAGGVCVGVLLLLTGYAYVEDWREQHGGIAVGDCLAGGRRDRPEPVGCEDAEAREVVLGVFEGEEDEGLCDRVRGARRAYVVPSRVDVLGSLVVCAGPRDPAPAGRPA